MPKVLWVFSVAERPIVDTASGNPGAMVGKVDTLQVTYLATASILLFPFTLTDEAWSSTGASVGSILVGQTTITDKGVTDTGTNEVMSTGMPRPTAKGV